ncbi:hypothetical protein TVAG_106730 [Trichomonas vaginalis G3]|uniref:Uncharacterized protein n=1 Tax=Trichomonas vaginalis (strain ATCC PRA-98 / G3) TaxID=412133 RepID=A2E6G5_TRIV3|nr:hypothetical protein TVAGG3_0040250 [Trichomonas vaginalis G3]EAY11778.1 hypothetical protein TVAG_106730 [Trichomonas vaginalis G3]KAI5540647.1 hypothetical protein TVAGG3_0040250 [Trichomonas vaginalis G3]|eukprot:XP_001324001.1 hypothetical protein [Trichomonas vaginalis G3]
MQIESSTDNFIQTLKNSAQVSEKKIQDILNEPVYDNNTKIVFRVQMQTLREFQSISKSKAICDLFSCFNRLGNLDDSFPNNKKDKFGFLPQQFINDFSNDSYLDVLTRIASNSVVEQNKIILELLIKIYRNHQSQDVVNYVSKVMIRDFKFNTSLHAFNAPSEIPIIPNGISLF